MFPAGNELIEEKESWREKVMDFRKIIFPSEKQFFQRGKLELVLFVSDRLSMDYHSTSGLFSFDDYRNEINSFFHVLELYESSC